MADYHILTVSEKDHEASVVFHIPVPDINNAIGYSLRTALAEYISQDEAFSSAISWLASESPAELTQLQNGEKYEHPETIEFNANLSDVEKRTIIDNRYTTLSTTIPNRIETTLKFWHLNRDVP